MASCERISVFGRALPDGRVQCTLCPRDCTLREGKRGACWLRRAQDGQMVLTGYGQTSGLCIDPIEKKPLYHFLPGSPVLSWGTQGCNLACRFCQNWSISAERHMDCLQPAVSAGQMVALAQQHGCRSIAATYNDPVIALEYVCEVARLAKAQGIACVAVTAGYIHPEPAVTLFADIAAANVDLKGFSERFYHDYCGGHLAPVLETLRYLYHHTSVWLEITTLLIPGANDEPDQIRAQCEWIARELSPAVPLHFSAFHPDYRLCDRPPTPPATLELAWQIAREAGLQHVYTGNVHPAHGTTCCAHCGTALIVRHGYAIGAYHLQAGSCPQCGSPLAGRFDGAFGSVAGDWGNRRQVVTGK